MENVFKVALSKVVSALDKEKIDYMVVGGFAVSYHNRVRTTNDIDLVVQIYPQHVGQILNHFPEWASMEGGFQECVRIGQQFNITDFETGIRFDFITYQDNDYNWSAFERREKVEFFGVDCFICSKEDLIISKLKWYSIGQSQKQYEDLKFLLLDESVDLAYLNVWITKLNLKTYGLLE